MCGIFGLYSKSSSISQATEEKVSEHFFQALHHRGPDSNGLFISSDRKSLLGHLRLSIVDVESGIQPMKSDISDTIVFNGEIYNHNELRASHDYNFSNHSDTEVILSGYKVSGEKSFNDLNGMYAFAIHSERDNSLTLAVDPLGIKSLYLYEDDELIIFSSELTALAQYIHAMDPELLEVDDSATYGFLQQGMFLEQTTPFKNIRKLKDGSWIRLSSEKSQGSIVYNSTFSEKDSLKDVVESSVERQLHADVDVCLFLSGGIDSSLVASIVSKTKKIKAFCLAFDEGDIDESSQAKLVAEDLGIDLEIVKIDPENLESLFEEALLSLDEPISDFATIPLLALSRKASDSYKVCLLGDGGDELFYGYTHHKYWNHKLLSEKLLPKLVFKSGLYSNLVRFFESSKSNFSKKVATFLKLAYPDGISYGPFTHYDNYLKDNLYTQQSLSSVSQLHGFELRNFLSRKLLQKSDRITMAASMEGRVPLLDLELYNFSRMFYNPENCIEKGAGKTPLRELLSDYISNEVYKNKKQGFRVPLSSWCSSDFGSKVRKHLLSCQFISKFISKESLSNLFKEFDSGNESHSVRIFTLYSYSVFMNNIIK
ncbi:MULTISPECIES: asparagine synthase (glutamine-hydrolyzing) [Pseudoalteromonas]|uniref:asparagine synthase (glutamine-hydrolyzing) n=1 Tax=Pseudoalteromonas rubra TaxID=43658 RepID=A0A5S3V537_9GAMM|nr:MULTISPECIES: asparagine synthase (glutamine-hydrolyzing) [Pseudoalteromonas]MCG7562504.1 asparagine synthase (glutamine-hydrolyzing) [Pseudoalteromonas sp. McH1-42]MEC4089940.1 asparagine synthase (glutamine-hydrolyzing) [Pseudoalteromonas rubra]QPB84630.1 asparagine synthase (glutamine-hydrolyzing) [Pseudoalteromonas rubra]